MFSYISTQEYSLHGRYIKTYLNTFLLSLFSLNCLSTLTVSKLRKRNPCPATLLFSHIFLSSTSVPHPPPFFFFLDLFFLLFLCVSEIEINSAVSKINSVMGICSLGLNDPQVSGFITN